MRRRRTGTRRQTPTGHKVVTLSSKTPSSNAAPCPAASHPSQSFSTHFSFRIAARQSRPRSRSTLACSKSTRVRCPRDRVGRAQMAGHNPLQRQPSEAQGNPTMRTDTKAKFRATIRCLCRPFPRIKPASARLCFRTRMTSP